MTGPQDEPSGPEPASATANKPPRRLMRATLAVAGITIFATLLLTRTELFREFEGAARDAQARLLPPRESDRVVIVEIDDDDYLALFKGVSPLAPGTVREVLDAVLAGGPRAVGVDLETSHRMYRDIELSANGTPVVWARDAVACEAHAPEGTATSACHTGGLMPLDYLGGREDEPFGLVTIQPDHGGTIRRYQRFVETTSGQMQSFAAGIVRAVVGPGRQVDSGDTRPLSIEFRRGTPLRISASTVLAWAADSTSDYRSSGPLRDRIVLFGGHYRAARDEHPTPLGLMPGVEIMAQALETELDGSGRPTPSPATLLLVQSLTVLLLVALFVRFSFKRAFLLSALALPLFALVGGWITTGVALTGFAYFLPLLIVMLIHILYEKVIEYREALMVELVGSAREPASGGHSEFAALDRVELGLGRALDLARDRIRRRSAGTRRPDGEMPPEDRTT